MRADPDYAAGAGDSLLSGNESHVRCTANHKVNLREVELIHSDENLFALSHRSRGTESVLAKVVIGKYTARSASVVQNSERLRGLCCSEIRGSRATERFKGTNELL